MFSCFIFEDPMVRAKVWLRQPWNFNMSFLVFAKVLDDGEINEKGFSVCPFWLQMQRISALWMTDKVGMLLVGKAGKVLAVEGDGGKLVGGKWLHARILVDITKPLKQGYWLTFATGDRRMGYF